MEEHPWPSADSTHTTSKLDSATLEVSCDSRNISADQAPGTVLEKQGLRQGVQEVFNTWLTQRMLVYEQATQEPEPKSLVFVRGQESAGKTAFDQETGIYTQRYTVQVTFRPRAYLRGEIIALEQERTMAANYDQVLIKGGQWTDQAKGAYFLVARGVPETAQGVLRMLGSGRIYNVLGKMAQGRLMETNSEIKVGDFVYPVQAEIFAEPEKTSNTAPPETEMDVEEVVVEPKPAPSREWTPPAEPK